MRQTNSITIQLLFCMLCLFFGGNEVLAQDSSPAVPLSRGQATEMIVKYFELEEKNSEFLVSCKEDYASCTFAFSARSNFDRLLLEPLILYPDVYPAYRYYHSINLASLLDLASGYYMEPQSPFRPEQPITKVEALKLVMGASGLLNWKEKFELTEQDKNWLVMSLDTSRWWYGRYLAEAASRGFIEQVSETEAEETISESELIKTMEAAKSFAAGREEASLARLDRSLVNEDIR